MKRDSCTLDLSLNASINTRCVAIGLFLSTRLH